ncbi:hypothetical protein P3521_03800 [Vibrio parahaemolyticus]|nr:hypothetical protein [Vibrio parahaemolyticus]MDF4668726.1 hypothetical protein [Vibrio parahaemolyticus]HAV1412725.1 hypothetical protein [Vibrio parahaemolyticus]HAV2004807.1 hypothetical protein [Vibrio parahaemolyticus]
MINRTGFEDKKALNLVNGDLGLFNIPDGGEIACVDGQAILDGGFDTPVFISLFSGSVGDWWANSLISDPVEKVGGEFEALTKAIPLIPAKLPDIQQAVERDLQWFNEIGITKSISVTLKITSVNTLHVYVLLTLQNEESIATYFNFNWNVQRTESLHERLQMDDVESLEPIQKPKYVEILSYNNGDLLGLRDGRVVNLTRSEYGA